MLEIAFFMKWHKIGTVLLLKRKSRHDTITMLKVYPKAKQPGFGRWKGFHLWEPFSVTPVKKPPAEPVECTDFSEREVERKTPVC